jgi:hypothetical protein
MTNQTEKTINRVLAIAPSSRGFGFAVIENGPTLVDWGVRSIGGDKNSGTLKKVQAMIAHYNPVLLVLGQSTFRSRLRQVAGFLLTSIMT